MESQPVKGYFIPRSWIIAFIVHYIYLFGVVVSSEFFSQFCDIKYSYLKDIWPVDGTLTLQVRIDQGVMPMKWYS